MHNTSDNFLFTALGLVVEPSGSKGYGFIKPIMKVVQPFQDKEYIELTSFDLNFELNGKDIFAHWKNIVSEDNNKSVRGGELFEFKIFRGN